MRSSLGSVAVVIVVLLLVLSVAVVFVVVSITGSKIPQTHCSHSLFPVLIQYTLSIAQNSA